MSNKLISCVSTAVLLGSILLGSAYAHEAVDGHRGHNYVGIGIGMGSLHNDNWLTLLMANSGSLNGFSDVEYGMHDGTDLMGRIYTGTLFDSFHTNFRFGGEVGFDAYPKQLPV
jgi:hypothetical protein